MNTTLTQAASSMYATTIVGNAQLLFAHIATDSRKIIDANATLFFALVGANSNGQKYIEAIEKK